MKYILLFIDNTKEVSHLERLTVIIVVSDL